MWGAASLSRPEQRNENGKQFLVAALFEKLQNGSYE